MPTNYTGVTQEKFFDDDEFETDSDPEIDLLLAEYQIAQGALLEAEERLEKVKIALRSTIEARGEQTVYGLNHRGESHRITVVASEVTKIDEAALLAAIGARAFNKLTARKVDKAKVEAAIAQGTLDISVLAEVTEVKPRAAYLKITRAEAA